MIHNEMPKDTVEETAKELRLAFYKRHSTNQYPKRMVDILDSYDIEVKQALTTAYNKGVEDGRQGCQISNFECSKHGKIMPEPRCLKCNDERV